MAAEEPSAGAASAAAADAEAEDEVSAEAVEALLAAELSAMGAAVAAEESAVAFAALASEGSRGASNSQESRAPRPRRRCKEFCAPYASASNPPHMGLSPTRHSAQRTGLP